MLTIPENFWNKIKIVIPAKATKAGRPQKEPWARLSGVFYVTKKH